MSLLDDIFKLKPGAKRVISVIYELLSNYKLTALNSLRCKWEGDLGKEISDDTWQKIIGGIYSSICLRHVVIQFKVVHRLHWSKTKLSKIKDGFDPTCDRCKQESATLLHMFWTCSKLNNFWECIFGDMSKMCGITLSPCASIAIFGLSLDNVPVTKSHANLIAFCTLLARRLIQLKWKDSCPPVYGHWVRDVMYYIQLEKIRYPIKGSTQKFYDIWQPFLIHFDNIEASKMA